MIFFVKGYRGFEQESELHLGRITLLLGPNNGGKSSLLRFLAAVCASLQNPEEAERAGTGLITKGDGWDIGSPSEWLPSGLAGDSGTIEFGFRFSDEELPRPITGIERSPEQSDESSVELPESSTAPLLANGWGVRWHLSVERSTGKGRISLIHLETRVGAPIVRCGPWTELIRGLAGVSVLPEFDARLVVRACESALWDDTDAFGKAILDQPLGVGVGTPLDLMVSACLIDLLGPEAESEAWSFLSAMGEGGYGGRIGGRGSISEIAAENLAELIAFADLCGVSEAISDCVQQVPAKDEHWLFIGGFPHVFLGPEFFGRGHWTWNGGEGPFKGRVSGKKVMRSDPRVDPPVERTFFSTDQRLEELRDTLVSSFAENSSCWGPVDGAEEDEDGQLGRHLLDSALESAAYPAWAAADRAREAAQVAWGTFLRDAPIPEVVAALTCVANCRSNAKHQACWRVSSQPLHAMPEYKLGDQLSYTPARGQLFPGQLVARDEESGHLRAALDSAVASLPVVRYVPPLRQLPPRIGMPESAGLWGEILEADWAVKQRLDAWADDLGLGVTVDWNGSHVPGPRGTWFVFPRVLDTMAATEPPDGSNSHSICDVGYGVSQVLPLLLACSVDKYGGRESAGVFVEQPELHLHPKVQARMAKILVEATDDNFACAVQTVTAETHSEHLVLRLQHEIRQGRLKPDDLCVHWVSTRMVDENNIPMPHVWRIPLNEQGRFTVPWPEGFFDESYEECFREPGPPSTTEES